MDALVTTRRYDLNGDLIEPIEQNGISFGALAPFSKSNIIILDCVISNVSTAGNLQLGIASTNMGQPISETLYYSVLDSLDNIVEPNVPFAGLSGYNGVENVINVGFRSALISKYVTLMLHAPNRAVNSQCFVLKWFFGFSKKEI